MTRVALYARFSSENQKESSITDQYRSCEQRAAREGWTISARYADRAISGSTNDRPQYKQMLADAQAKQFDILLLDDLSRLTRDEGEAIQVRKRLVFWGVRLVTVSDGIDTEQRGHKMIASFKGIMNSVFLDDLRDKTRRGMIGQVIKGYHGGGRSYGYRLVPEYDPSRIDPYGQPSRIGTRLEIDPDQARWVQWIFKQYADGVSPVKIVEELNRQGVPPPGTFYKRKSAKPPSWCASALYGNVMYGLGMLNNRLYKGELTWGRSRWEKDPDTKRKKRFLCQEQDWLKQSAEHLRIIDEPLWDRVKSRQQEVHQRNADLRTALHLGPRTSTGRGPKYLFSGLLVCGQCGHRFVIVNPTRYGCSGWRYRGLSVCNNTIMAPRKLIESALLQAIQRDLFTEDGFALFRKEVADILAERRKTEMAMPQKEIRRLEQVEQEIANIMTAIKAGILTASTKEALEKAEAERKRLQNAIAARGVKNDKVALLLPNLDKRFGELVSNMSTTSLQHVDKARAVLRGMLGHEIQLHPCSDGTERYLTAEVSGDYAGLLRLVGVKNNVGGGHGS